MASLTVYKFGTPGDAQRFELIASNLTNDQEQQLLAALADD